MHLVFHTGAHFTEEERLLKCLLRNQDDFATRGVAVPGPGKYRKLIRDTLIALRDQAPSDDAREVLMDAMLDNADANRVILSNAHFLGAPRAAVEDGLFYPKGPEMLGRLQQLFPDDRIEVFMALRNPATFLPAVFQGSDDTDFRAFLGDTEVTDLRWSNLIRRIREETPSISLTLWCNEDAPFLWGQIIREMAHVPMSEKIIGGFDLLAAIMSREGMTRFRGYLKSHPVMSETQKRRVIAAFLDKFALQDEIEEELDLPGWTDALVDELTEIYDDDVFRIQSMPGVRLILP